MFNLSLTTRFYRDCISIDPIDRNYFATELETLRAIGGYGGGHDDLNPSQRARLAELERAGSFGHEGGVPSPTGSYLNNRTGSPTSVTSPTTSFDPVAQAQKLLEFQRQANQPAIQTLQTEKGGLHEKYQALLDNIRGQQTVAENKQTTITANELGQRGLLPSDTYGQQQIQNALLPVRTSFGGVLAQAGLGEQQNLLNLATQISSLQRANPESAISSALQFGNIQNQAQQFAQEFGLKQQQLQAEAPLRAAQTQYYSNLGKYETARIGKANYIPLGRGHVLDITTGQIINAGAGGGGGGVGADYYGNISSEPRPTYVAKIGQLSPGGQWIQTNDGWDTTVP